MTEGRRSRKKSKSIASSAEYRYPESKSLMRPDVGTQAQFRKKKSPKRYSYDSSVSPALDWDGKNSARELGEWLIECIQRASLLPPPHRFDQVQEFMDAHDNPLVTVSGLGDAVDHLKRLSQPFLNWAGKAERLSFDVPTLPLFIHERLSTKAILETLKGHKRNRQLSFVDLFGDPQHPIHDQILRAYKHKDGWVNRLILGDSLVVMNSLLQYEGLAGQVQMIYMDPPYGVKYGSNFQPFVRNRTVHHNEDDDLTREPEMVKAYRDTWELGVHSWLTYIRDRLLLLRELLNNKGSIFVQISDENVHLMRSIMDEVFGRENFHAQINYRSMSPLGHAGMAQVYDYVLWYNKDSTIAKYNPIFMPQKIEDEPEFAYLDIGEGKYEKISREDLNRLDKDVKNRIFKRSDLHSSGYGKTCDYNIEFGSKIFQCGKKSWRTHSEGMQNLINKNRIFILGKNLYFKQYYSDFPFMHLENSWNDTAAGYSETKKYVVETNPKVIERCLLMTTDPGDLVLDPTCGGGTSAYVAELWGRRWITIDTSRVPLALSRQRLLTNTYPYYHLRDEFRGPAGGFNYIRRQNNKGDEIGGIVPQTTLKSIANNEPPEEVVLVDRPEADRKITRVTGPFTVEATIPTPIDWEGDGVEDSGFPAEEYGSFLERMLEVLRRSPVLHFCGGNKVTFKNVHPPAKTLSLSAEAFVGDGQDKPVAIVFGPENGAVSEKLVYEAAREAHAKGYTHLFVIGFAIQPHARRLVEESEEAVGIPASYCQATPDLMMGDLLKNMRSSQIFSCCGLPEIKIFKVKPKKPNDQIIYQVELLGLDVFDPATMDVRHHQGDDVPAWLLDTDYNGLCFHVNQAFFPRTSAWDNLKRALKGEYEDDVWDRLSGTTSAPFEAGEYGQIAVKVIDDRGNELMVIKSVQEAEEEAKV